MNISNISNRFKQVSDLKGGPAYEDAVTFWGWAVVNEDFGKRAQSIQSLESSMIERAYLKECAVDGMVAVQVWQRDCDQCEATYKREIRATLPAYNRLEADVYDGAEGPVRITILTPEEAAEWKSSFRDRRAEQYNY